MPLRDAFAQRHSGGWFRLSATLIQALNPAQVLDGDMLGGTVQMRGRDVRKERVHGLGHVYWAKYNASTMYAHDARVCTRRT